MWPRSGEQGQPWPISIISGTPAVLGFLWVLIGLVPLIVGGTEHGPLGFGAYLQLGSLLLLAIISVLELYYGLQTMNPEPEAAAAVGETAAAAG
jgi:hypothetical protein